MNRESEMQDIQMRSPESLTNDRRNPRKHTKSQVRAIADSIQRYGFTTPILIDARGGILAGHARLQAAKLLGLSVVPTLCLSHLSEAERRAYIIADNQLGTIEFLGSQAPRQ